MAKNINIVYLSEKEKSAGAEVFYDGKQVGLITKCDRIDGGLFRVYMELEQDISLKELAKYDPRF